MDSFHYNQSYDQWNSPYSPHHPPPAPLLLPLLPPPRQSHPDSPNFYLPSTHNSGQPMSHKELHNLRLQLSHSPNLEMSPWDGYKDKRVDSWTNAGPGRMNTSGRRLDPSPSRDYQYDYNPCSELRHALVGRQIEGSYQDRGQLKAESDRCFRDLGEGNRSLASRVGYGTDRHGVTVSRDMGRSSTSHEGTRNQRWDEGRILYPRKKDNYYHSETEQYFDQGRREESSELNRTPRKQMQKKSALLRLETPRNHQKGRENGRNHSNYNGKWFNSNLFRGKEHLGRSDRRLVEKQRERTPVDLDVSFELNLMVAKPIASPAGACIHPSRSVTPRSFKARRALVSDKSSRPSKRQSISSEIEMKPGNHSTPSSSDSGGMNKVSFVDGVVQNYEVKITDGGPEALTREVITVDAAEKNSSVCEALKEAKDDSDVEHDSNMGVCSIIEDVIERGKSILNSQDVLNKTGCNAGEALPPKVMEIEDIVKESRNRSPTKLLLPLSTAAGLSEYSEAVVRFARKFMCSVKSHHCEDVAINCSPSRNTPMEEGLIFSASLEIPSVSMELANANNNISGDLANAHTFTIGTCPSTIVDSPDMSESKNPTHCENMVNPLVENSSRKETMETKPLRSVAEMADNLESDEGIHACVKGIFSSHSKVDVKGSLVVLPAERTDGYSRSYKSDLDMAVPSEVGMESLSAERLAPVEDMGLASNHLAKIPSVDKLSGSNNKSLKTCLPEPNVSPNKDITDGSSKGLVQRDVSQNASTFCGNLPSSLALVIETNPAVGINGMSANETVTKAESGPHERQPCSPVGKFLPEDQGGCGSSGAFGSPCLVSDNSVSPCHISPLMAMNEQMQNKTFVQTNYSESQVVSFDSLSNSPNLYRPIDSETHVASMVDDSNNYNEKVKPSGGTTKYRTPESDVNSDVGGLEKYSRNNIKTDIFDGEALSADGKVAGT
ncbi:hypothetical protein YC2023_070848 [Brassica napus]